MIYLDHAATCPTVKYSCSNYGSFFNPNANYAYKEKQLLRECEDRVRTAIGAKSGKIIFGGTTSQLIENLMNAAVNETNFYHVVCSVYEHDSCFRFHQSTVNNVEFLDRLLESYQSFPEDYDKVFVMWQGVNNITGEFFPVAEIGKSCRKHDAFYICDMTAMIGHTSIPDNIDDWCDCAVWSGHKLGTELGIGAMWISDELDKWFNGFKLHGTPNLAGALAVVQAVEEACDKDRLISYENKWSDLVNELDSSLDKINIKHNFIPVVGVEEAGKPFALAINAIHLPGINADSLQQYLASKQIYVGVGHSSCADSADYMTLMSGYGLTKQESSEVIRVSFGKDSSVEDVVTLVEEIKNFKETYID